MNSPAQLGKLDLGLVSIDELVRELRRRSIHFVFGHIAVSEDTESREAYYFLSHGSMFTCLGLAEAIADDLRFQIRKVEAQTYPEGG